jgi:predicted TIM-barrel fold metal-dependent hydrolase
MSSYIPSSHTGVHGIDIHHHFIPPILLKALAECGHPAAESTASLAWSPEKSLAMLDETGFETAVLSLSLPGVSFTGAMDSPALARQCNEFGARLIADYPGRFGAFASLPMLDADVALDEIEYALDTLKLDGVMLLSNVCGKYLGVIDFDPVLAELNRRKAIVFLHPNQPPKPGFNDFVEFPHEVTRALASLTESGGIERFRRIRFILAYGGGTIPFIASRVTVVGMDVFSSFLVTMVHFIKRMPTMQRMNYDLTATTDPYALRALIGHTKSTRILMGSNFPWTSIAEFKRQCADLRDFEGIDLSTLESIERSNSLKLFPRFA